VPVMFGVSEGVRNMFQSLERQRAKQRSQRASRLSETRPMAVSNTSEAAAHKH